MSRPLRHHWLAASAFAGALLMTGTQAEAEQTTSVDLEAGLGFASNPFLNINSQSTAFGRVSAYGQHNWSSERSATSIHGYVENTTYFKDYGSKQIFDVGAHTSLTASPTVTVFGDADFSGDFAGQLSSRLYGVPSKPPVVEPGNPLPPVTTNPDLFGLSGRQYRIFGQVGAAIRSGARGTISLSAGAQRSWFTGNEDADYNSYFGSAGYSQQISERTSAGASINLQRQDFRHGDYANIVNPVLTIHSQLTEDMVGDAAFGILAIEQRTDGEKDHSISPSFSGSLCKVGEISRFCGRIARDAQSSLSSHIANGSGAAAISTIGSVEYFRKLSARETLQASLSATRYTTPTAVNGENFKTTYLSSVLGYDRKIGNRLAAGVSGGVRKLFQDGPDPDLDFNASVYLRYRLGDLL